MITTKGRYALRLMIDLAENASDGYIPLKEAADRQNISKKYLEIIVKDLVKGGLIKGISGKGGGYRLCKNPDEYSVGEILEAAEGPLMPVSCLVIEGKPCDKEKECHTLPLWNEYDTLVHNFFFNKKLTELVNK